MSLKFCCVFTINKFWYFIQGRTEETRDVKNLVVTLMPFISTKIGKVAINKDFNYLFIHCLNDLIYVFVHCDLQKE